MVAPLCMHLWNGILSTGYLFCHLTQQTQWRPKPPCRVCRYRHILHENFKIIDAASPRTAMNAIS
jgi:hypothetical protein